MSKAEELLNSLSETVVEHKHEVPDSDTYFMIDPYTRKIENTNYLKTVLMRGDHNSERFTFGLPRYVDGHDMSLCNRVIVHFDNVGDSIENINSDVAYTDDLRIDPNNPDLVICSWLIRREATQIVGILSFSLQYLCVEGEEITYEWNTDSYDDIEIRKSKNNGEAAIVKYTNVLEQWRSQIFGAGDSVMSSIATEGQAQVTAVQNESATQQAAIELKGSETLATIPEDYTEVYNMASEAVRTKADGVVCEAEGNAITITDASDDYVRGLNVYGKSTQFTTTGKNLLKVPDSINTIKGISFTVNSDRSISVSGTPTEICAASIYGTYGEPIAFPAGTYIISGGVDVNRYIRVRIHSSDGTLTGQKYADGNDKEFTINDGDLISVSIYFATLESVNGLTFYPMIRSATAENSNYEPYTGGIPSPNPEYPQEIISVDNTTVHIYNSNLLKEWTGYSKTYNGITCDYEGDGVYHIYGTFTGDNPSMQFAAMDLNIPVDSTAKYTLSGELVDGIPPDDYHPYIGLSSDAVGHRNWMALKIDNTKKIGEVTNNTLIPSDTLENPKYINRFWIYVYNDTLEPYTADFRIRVWLTKSDTPMPYETYNERIIKTTCTIPGIPVSSGGNYTDESSQQWVCDEVDLERGVLIQRIGTITFDETLNYHLNSYRFDREGKYVFGCVAEGMAVPDTPMLSDKLRFKKWGDWNTNTENNLVCYTGYSFYVYLADQTIQTSNAFKEYVTENPISVKYIRETPIETPLTAEEIEIYKSLKTNYPNTTVLNDSGAMMKVKYNADTKLYISNTVETGVVKVVEDVINDTY